MSLSKRRLLQTSATGAVGASAALWTPRRRSRRAARRSPRAAARAEAALPKGCRRCDPAANRCP